MKFFIAGVMRGSLSTEDFEDQDYRRRIREVILDLYPNATIIDPLEGCNEVDSNSGTEEEQRQTFFQEIRDASRVDVLIAYLPEASMGTAVEMYEAFVCNITVITISPLIHNWTVKFLSHHNYLCLEDFERDPNALRIKDE